MLAILPDGGRFGQHSRRLAAFFTISIAVHLLTVVGVGRFDLFAGRFGDNPGPFPLHATLMPGAASVPGAPPAAQATKETEVAAPAATRSESTSRPETKGEEAGLALPAPDKWYTAQEVDVRAEPLASVQLRYPENLRGEPIVGKVRLRVFIDERGVVRKIQVAESEPAGVFDDAARKAWEDVAFAPAIRNGAPVKSQKLLELTYQPGLM